jgi:hypothetical protein
MRFLKESGLGRIMESEEDEEENRAARMDGRIGRVGTRGETVS